MPLVTNEKRPTLPNSPGIPQTPMAGPQQVRHMSKAYRGVTVDTAYQPRQNIIMHVEGSPWSVNYYSQMIGLDDAVQGQGLGTLGIQQQYKLVRNMEVRVQSPLSPSQISETKEMVYTGTAVVYPFVIPNVGDIFLADIGDGREGVFQVTSSERKSIYREACHEIEYKMLDYSSNGRVEDLDKKTVQIFHFERDFIKHGHNPLLFEHVFKHYIVLRDAYPRLVDLFLRRFYSQEFTTLCVPDQAHYTYDPFHARGFNSHFGRWDTATFKHIRILNADEDPAMSAFSLWDAIAARDRLTLNSAFQRAGVVDVSRFNKKSYYDGIRFSGFKRTIYPEDPMPNAQSGHSAWEKKTVMPFMHYDKTPGPRRISDFLAIDQNKPHEPFFVEVRDHDMLNNPSWVRPMEQCDQHYDHHHHHHHSAPTVVIPPPPPPPIPPLDPTVIYPSVIIHPAMSDGYYVFSKAFWENDMTQNAQSKLELIVQDFIDHQAISYERIHEIYIDSFKWNALDSFYYLPILLVMMKVVVLTN